MKALITTSSFAEFSSEPLDLLSKQNIHITLNNTGKKVSEEYLLTELTDTTILIAGTETLSKTILTKAPHLKVISRVGTGIDAIDLAAAKELSIAIKNVPDGPTDAVAELTLGLMLDLSRKISYSDKNIRSNIWTKPMGSLLKGKTIGLIGYGNISQKVESLLTPFNVTLLIYDPYCHHKKTTSLPDLLKHSDIITIHTPITPETTNLIGFSELSSMKKTAFLLNISRGGIVNEDALFKALTDHTIAGAAIDTFITEPYTGPLSTLDNIILTPHIGSYAKESRIYMELKAVENALDAIR